MEESVGFSMMAAEDLMDMPARPMNGKLEDFGKDLDLEALLLEHRRQQRSRAAAPFKRESELNIIRSGSAPPTVEGERNAVGSLSGNPDLVDVDWIYGYGSRTALTEAEMRSHPAYPRYYYSNGKVNSRLPPSAVAKEDWSVSAQRLQLGASAVGRIGDRRRVVEENNGSGSSLFSLQPGLPQRDMDGELANLRPGSHGSLARQPSAEWVQTRNGDLIGSMSNGLGTRSKSFADALQQEHGQFSYVSAPHPSRPVNHNAFANVIEPVGVSNAPLTQLQSGLEILHNLKTGASSPRLVRAQSLGSSVSHSFASGLGTSCLRSKTPDPQIIGNSQSPRLPMSRGRDEISSNCLSMCVADHNDLAVPFSGLNLSKSILVNGGNDVCSPSFQEFADKTDYHNNYLQHMDMHKPEANSLSLCPTPMLSIKDGVTDTNLSTLLSNGQIKLPNNVTSASTYQKLLAGSRIPNGSGIAFQNPNTMNADSSRYVGSFPVIQGLSTSVNNQLDIGGLGGQHFNTVDHAGSGLQHSYTDPLYVQYLQQNNSASNAAARFSGPFLGWNTIGSSQMDLSDYQKASLEVLLSQNRSRYGVDFVGKSGGLNHGCYDTVLNLDKQYPENTRSVSILSSLGTAVPLGQGERFSRFPSMTRRSAGTSTESWNLENAFTEEGSASSLLEEFKSSKARSFELSEIVGHLVEFSADQHGSRFIQQKLETASVDEKNKIFPEILPHARALMTDVFGNYVIQKFFEHGTESQRKQLADELTGHVLPLSLQMYGCRVIQKALEVVDVDQQTKMVLELDGSVMKCVHDQNGNHVIQKCIECVPQERIQFIISVFYGQVVPLSMHPYGCRVIQRVLEHCDDPTTQNIMMDEIQQTVCILAQDQYGNYVIQHVLQHGKQQERSAIIHKLAGQIVKMSRQKFASNVIEKCLLYGMPEERQLLINEILGSTDENEPLQAMMKDQFGNYVVQKVLETCDDQNRELILSRIKAHVNALKKYTYGKHIAARVEKVIAAGERCMGMSSNAS